ncbi:MAG: hypothetical protein GYB64_18350 [Chloroflexi bacterium]|nr:hypothetical protein [Chloroflexota bacterium]
MRIRVTKALTAFIAWAVGLIGPAYTYAQGGGGRYMLTVLQQVDPRLFPADPVVASYGLFASLFYDGLGLLFDLAGLHASQVEPAMFVVYAMMRALLVAALLFLADSLATNQEATLPTFILLAALFAFERSALLGGVSLITPQANHTNAALIAGIVGLAFLLRQQLLAFWVMAGLAIFLHSLVGLHLGMIALPALLLHHRRIDPHLAAGVGFFTICSLIYLLAMAPPSLTGEAAETFLFYKGQINHISPFTQSPVGYVQFGLLGATAVAGHWRCTRLEQNHRLLSILIVVAAVVGMAFALVTVFSGSARLAQMQPMRVFFWATFIAYALLAAVTTAAWQNGDRISALVVFTAVLLSIVPGFWALLALPLALITLLGRHHPLTEARAAVGVGVLGAGMLVGWPLAQMLPFSLGSFNWAASLIGFLLLILTVRRPAPVRTLAPALIAVALAGAWALQPRPAFDPAWQAVLAWSRSNTPVDAQFVVPPDAPPFRLYAFRSAINAGSSAMVWVDPPAYEAFLETQQAVTGSAAFTHPEVDYIIHRGAIGGQTAVFQAGQYHIYTAPSESSNR